MIFKIERIDIGDENILYVKRFEELTTQELYEILKVRAVVFVVEQNCIYQDLDEKDKRAYHVFLAEGSEIKAYLRILDRGVAFGDVAIGRVLTTERGGGLGHRILEEGIKVAGEKMNAERIILEAQSYIKRYYESHGFIQVSDEFLEDGIPHIKMMLEFGNNAAPKGMNLGKGTAAISWDGQSGGHKEEQ